MSTSAPSVGEVLRRFGPAFLAKHGSGLGKAQRIALHNLAVCRTPFLGGHLYRCDSCGHERIAYDSCRDRHCPACQAYKSREWLRDRARELLPTKYFHVVFTVPETVAALALGNKKIVYSLLLRCVGDTLCEVAANPKRLGAQLGFMAVLHTWSQTLQHHPHVHCVVPGGGLAFDGSRWISSRPKFLLPVRVLSRVFRAKFIDALRHAAHNGDLRFGGSTADLAEPEEFERWLSSLRRTAWVVYSKRPFGSAIHVLKYLAAYTHRVAISNRRIVSLDAAGVTFRYRDRTAPGRSRLMRLDGGEFIRRFLLHVLPQGFTRIRYYGFMANRVRKEKLKHCRRLLGGAEVDLVAAGLEEPTDDTVDDDDDDPVPRPRRRCPECPNGRLCRTKRILPFILHQNETPAAVGLDTS